jgi:nucleoside-diphosphate-sugar epimerase
MPTAGSLKNAILKYLPDSKLSFNPDPLAMAFHKMSQGVCWDDTPAQKEWGWEVKYKLEALVEDFIREMREHPAWYR